MISPYIFREYDIRGRIDVEDELSDENIYGLARAAATFFKRHNIDIVIVGHDARAYSQKVKDIVILGLSDSGIDVLDIGQVLVPIFYFAQYHLKQKGGIMVTASHNPNGWSGMKVANDYSTTLLGEQIKELGKIFNEKDFISGKGRVKKVEGIISDYSSDILNRIKISRPMRVLVDAGNGTAGPIVPGILKKAGYEVIERHCNLDATFPNHEPNPSNLTTAQDIAQGVIESGADVGFGFDDDGDRIGFSDNKGNIVWPDKALIFLARGILRKYPGSSIVCDIKSSRALLEDVEASGGKPVIWKTGHSYIKQKSKEVDAALAGERSGHIFFRKDYYGYDDAPFAALKFLEYLTSQEKSFSELMKTIPQYISSPVWEPHCDDGKKYQIVQKITDELKTEYGAKNVLDINGARVNFADGWGLIRASSNLPALSMVFEAKTEEGLKTLEDLFRDKLSKYPEVSKEWKSG